MDRRLTPFSGRVALISLKGVIEAEAFVEGEDASICKPVVDLLDKPNGSRDRQLLLGEAVKVIDRRDGHAFVQAAKDGYCGWLTDSSVGTRIVPTHWLAVPASHAYSGPKVQARELCTLPMGALFAVRGEENRFVETQAGFVPKVHLRPIGVVLNDPVAVAESFLGTPYLWGGNSREGIDCSGLVQTAFLACGKSCPGDSDLQRAIGTELKDTEPLQRGDLLFWKGHVAMVVDQTRLIHANGHSMSVAYEGIQACIDRIQATEGLGVIARRRS